MLISAFQCLLAYFSQPSALLAVLVPAGLSILFVHRSRNAPLPEGSWFLALLGLAITVIFSAEINQPGQLSVHALPGYLLLLATVPARYRPSGRQGYAFAFAIALGADLWGTTKLLLATHAFSLHFFYGIGGGGLRDGLFLDPLATWLALEALGWLKRNNLEQVELADALRTLTRHARPLAPLPLSTKRDPKNFQASRAKS